MRSTERNYELFVPPETDGKTPLPVVFVFHGKDGTGGDVRNAFALEAEAKGKAVFVYPDGLNRDWNYNDPATRNDDVLLFDALLEKLSNDVCIDRARVFAAGFSNGGYFANHLGCRRGGALRAVASHSGGGPTGASIEIDDRGNLTCPEAPVAALIVHGIDDTNVKLEEAKKSVAHWNRVNGCRSGTSPFGPPPCAMLAGCAKGREIVTCEVPSLGHSIWPGDGARVTWQFFETF